MTIKSLKKQLHSFFHIYVIHRCFLLSLGVFTLLFTSVSHAETRAYYGIGLGPELAVAINPSQVSVPSIPLSLNGRAGFAYSSNFSMWLGAYGRYGRLETLLINAAPTEWATGLVAGSSGAQLSLGYVSQESNRLQRSGFEIELAFSLILADFFLRAQRINSTLNEIALGIRITIPAFIRSAVRNEP